MSDLLSILTQGKSGEASTDLEQALQDIQGVQTPTAQEMQYKVQQLVQAGVLTPEQAQTFLQSPNALASENVDQTGTQAQQAEIGQLLDAADAGGLTPEEQAQMTQLEQQVGSTEKGANDAVVQNQAARGALTSGETLASQLENNQQSTVAENTAAANNAAAAYQQMLQELTTAGTAGTNLQGQENTQANTVASATNAINQFNAAQQQGEENLNVGNANEAQAANLSNLQGIENQNTTNNNTYSAYVAQLPQEVEQDQMQKANALAGVSEAEAGQDTGQGEQNASIIGGITGLGGSFEGISPTGNKGVATPSTTPAQAPQANDSSAGTNSFPEGIFNADEGGEVPGQAESPGDSPRNDKIPALLSPKEMVLPRSVAIPAMKGDSHKVMDFLNRMRAKKQMTPPPVHPHDIKGVLDALTMRRGGHQ